MSGKWKLSETKTLNNTLSSLYILTAIFPGDSEFLACFIEVKDDGSGGDNWSYTV